MSGWYGHTVTVEIENNLKFKKFNGRLSLLNSAIEDEFNDLSKRLEQIGTNILNEVAMDSRVLQQNTITELGAVDTGRLRDSVEINISGLSASIGTDLYYAEQVHDIGYKDQKIFNINGLVIRGHSEIGPRPWVTISAEKLARDIDEIVVTNINKFY